MMPSKDSELCRGRDCRGRERMSHRYDRAFARRWVQQSKTDVHKMVALRSLLWQESNASAISRMSDEEMIDHLAGLLASGRFHFHSAPAQTVPTTGRAGGGDAQKPVAFPLAERTPRPAVAASGTPISDPPTFPPNIDGAAQAGALAAAASGGQPFCPQ